MNYFLCKWTGRPESTSRRRFSSSCTAVLFSLVCIAQGASGVSLAAEAATDAQAKRPLTLNDVQDCGICLKQIRQQAINIYVETTRTPVKPDAPPELPDIKSIPYQVQEKVFLDPRREWLLFYLGSMEPVIRDLETGVGGSKQALNPVIPAAYKSIFLPLWEEWGEKVKKLNGHLDELLTLITDAPHNRLKIQNVAVNIYQSADSLENSRRTIFKAMQEELKAHPDSKILITPP